MALLLLTGAATCEREKEQHWVRLVGLASCWVWWLGRRPVEGALIQSWKVDGVDWVGVAEVATGLPSVPARGGGAGAARGEV